MVWDIDKDGVPHDLGVLGHFDAVVWYLGDNRLTQDAADDPVQSVIGPLPDSQVADRAKDLMLNVRSYINEGGKLAARRGDGQLLRPAPRGERRRHLLRHQGASRAAVLHLDELPRRLRAALG